MKQLISFLIFLTFSLPTFAQANISGLVTGDSKEPLSGVLIFDSEKTQYTTTDEFGKFSIEVNQLPVTLHFESIDHASFYKLFATTDFGTIQLKMAPILVNEILVKEAVPNQFMISDTKQVYNAKNVNDLFGDLTGFNLVKRSNYATEPVLRGFKYERLNIQYDGAAKIVHACPNRMDPITSHVIPEEIEKIEVVKGPFDVRYGAAFGGIVNLITKIAALIKALS